ncbi:MAG TPA: TonB-dependent receptor [Bacteroidia bacterium]|jgi:iron complex outermembrane receptor protein|nr:TonB-dependent receptor [Bacteroidia bacterium]
MIRNNIVIFFLFFASLSNGQTTDSVLLNEVHVSSYFSSRPLLRLPTSAAVLDTNALKKQVGTSLVPVVNTIPGVRMEERSPGSYRLSIRGSLLRSPFGIRNIKIYIDGFPLTDGGGNTYLNLVDLNAIRSIEVLKGPDGSLFGPNSGGVVRLNTLPTDTSTQLKAGIGTGSYGLFHEYISAQYHVKKNTFQLVESWQRSDGYRENSGLDRKYVQLSDQFRYHPKAQLTLLLFYANLHYQTPGGLTLEEWNDSPGSARPGTKFTKGAVEQQAGIYNTTFYGGLSHQVQLSEHWNHHISVLGSITDFKNPFITNYEVRKEHTIGTRTWFEASNHNEGDLLLKFHIGGEVLQTDSDIKNYNNDFGERGASMKFDKLKAAQSFVFSNLVVDFKNKWLLETGLSYNLYNYSFSSSFPVTTRTEKRSFQPQWMPKLAISYQVAAVFAWRGSVSRGYSPPAIAEIRSSNNIVNTNLQPENGWNAETGVRLHTRNNFIWWDISVFTYKLKEAIVRTVDQTGEDEFTNAGATKQTGFESQLLLQLIPKRNVHFIRGLEINNAYTYTDFRFSEYNYIGNKVTGVPASILVSGITIRFPHQSYVYVQHYYSSSIFLDDANTISAPAYSLWMIKAGSTVLHKPHFSLNLSAGVDNLFNEKYSLGNDLNAMGGRYYNAAMPRNFFCKVEIAL